MVGTIVVYNNDDDSKKIIIQNIGGYKSNIEIPKAKIDVNVIEERKFEDIENNNSDIKETKIIFTITCQNKNGVLYNIPTLKPVSNASNEELFEELKKRNALPKEINSTGVNI